MDSARILIAMSSEASAGKLKGILAESGYIVVEQALDGNDCIRKVRTLKPDLTVVEFNLPAMNGVDVSKILLEDGLSDVVLLTASTMEANVNLLKHHTGFTYLVKPVNRTALIASVDLMLRSSKRIKELQGEIDQLKSSLDTRKEVEKAKGLLMKYLNLTEAEAFKRIQKQSMDRGIAMKEIAKAIILAYDI